MRGEIDRIDGEIHDLLLERAELSAEIAEAKRGTADAGMRPDREAQILRRLLARHRGPLPRALIAHIWREMIAAMVRLQGALKVAVCAPEKSVGYWDLARAHYGLSTPMTLHRAPGEVLRAVAEGDGTIGVLPLPQEDDPDPWWPNLAVGRGDGPRVIARLPFVDSGEGRSEDLSALVVANCEAGRSGDDVSLLILAAQSEISRARLHEHLGAAGLEGRWMAGAGGRGESPEFLHLFEISDFVAKKDSRIDVLLSGAVGAIDRVVPVGSYAAPYRRREPARPDHRPRGPADEAAERDAGAAQASVKLGA